MMCTPPPRIGMTAGPGPRAGGTGIVAGSVIASGDGGGAVTPDDETAGALDAPAVGDTAIGTDAVTGVATGVVTGPVSGVVSGTFSGVALSDAVAGAAVVSGEGVTTAGAVGAVSMGSGSGLGCGSGNGTGSGIGSIGSVTALTVGTPPVSSIEGDVAVGIAIGIGMAIGVISGCTVGVVGTLVGVIGGVGVLSTAAMVIGEALRSTAKLADGI
jgi:hypothetical protein